MSWGCDGRGWRWVAHRVGTRAGRACRSACLPDSAARAVVVAARRSGRTCAESKVAVGSQVTTTASAGHVLFAFPHHAPSPGPAQDGFRGAKVDRCCVRGSAEVRQGQSSLHPSAPAPLVRRVPKRVARPRPECMRADLLVRLFSTRVAARPPPRTLRLRLRPQLPTPPPTCAAPATCFSRPSATNASHCSCTKPT